MMNSLWNWRPAHTACRLAPRAAAGRAALARTPSPDAMIARGMTNPEIAKALVLSNHTVKSHISRIFAKTRSRDRAAATQYAQAHNLH